MDHAMNVLRTMVTGGNDKTPAAGEADSTSASDRALGLQQPLVSNTSSLTSSSSTSQDLVVSEYESSDSGVSAIHYSKDAEESSGSTLDSSSPRCSSPGHTTGCDPNRNSGSVVEVLGAEDGESLQPSQPEVCNDMGNPSLEVDPAADEVSAQGEPNHNIQTDGRNAYNLNSGSIRRKHSLPKIYSLSLSGSREVSVQWAGASRYIGSYVSWTDARIGAEAAETVFVAQDESSFPQKGETSDVISAVIERAQQAARRAVASVSDRDREMGIYRPALVSTENRPGADTTRLSPESRSQKVGVDGGGSVLLPSRSEEIETEDRTFSGYEEGERVASTADGAPAERNDNEEVDSNNRYDLTTGSTHRKSSLLKSFWELKCGRQEVRVKWAGMKRFIGKYDCEKEATRAALAAEKVFLAHDESTFPWKESANSRIKDVIKLAKQAAKQAVASVVPENEQQIGSNVDLHAHAQESKGSERKRSAPVTETRPSAEAGSELSVDDEGSRKPARIESKKTSITSPARSDSEKFNGVQGLQAAACVKGGGGGSTLLPIETEERAVGGYEEQVVDLTTGGAAAESEQSENVDGINRYDLKSGSNLHKCSRLRVSYTKQTRRLEVRVRWAGVGRYIGSYIGKKKATYAAKAAEKVFLARDESSFLRKGTSKSEIKAVIELAKEAARQAAASVSQTEEQDCPNVDLEAQESMGSARKRSAPVMETTLSPEAGNEVSVNGEGTRKSARIKENSGGKRRRIAASMKGGVSPVRDESDLIPSRSEGIETEDKTICRHEDERTDSRRYNRQTESNRHKRSLTKRFYKSTSGRLQVHVKWFGVSRYIGMCDCMKTGVHAANAAESVFLAQDESFILQQEKTNDKIKAVIELAKQAAREAVARFSEGEQQIGATIELRSQSSKQSSRKRSAPVTALRLSPGSKASFDDESARVDSENTTRRSSARFVSEKKTTRRSSARFVSEKFRGRKRKQAAATRKGGVSRASRAPGTSGVRYSGREGKWRADINLGRSFRRSVGFFDTEEQAILGLTVAKEKLGRSTLQVDLDAARGAAREAVKASMDQVVRVCSRKHRYARAALEQVEDMEETEQHGKSEAVRKPHARAGDRKKESTKEVGSRVYCRWNKDEWYWGTIEKKRRKSRGKTILFSVRFDDGDYLEGIMPQHVYTVQSYRRIYGKEPPPPDAASQLTSASRNQSRRSDLVGKGTLHQWTDVHGNQKVVYGRVTGCEVDKDREVAIVEYDHESRENVNTIINDCGTSVPASGKIPRELAAGACEAFAKEVLSRSPETARSKASWTWFTPLFRKEELLDLGYGVTLPRLTLTFRGYHLVFFVKESTIPNSGYGLFVKATPTEALDAKDGLVLDVGEFLDLGVYAPFRKQDKKKMCVFFLKSYIHSFKCEEWCFNTDNDHFEFDITEDVTGDVHELARRHIPSYVNECGSEQVPTIRAETDPEGNVHFLLGVVQGEKLSIPGDGSEMELFANYGPKYEPVRLRKGYSQLPEDEKARRLEELDHMEEEYLDAIASNELDEIGACVEFLHGIFRNNGFPEAHASGLFGAKAGERALRVAEVFEETLATLQESGTQVPLGMSQSVRSLVSILTRMFVKDPT